MLQTTKQLVREYSIPMFALWDQVVTQNCLFRGARDMSASVDGLVCGDNMIPFISLIFGYPHKKEVYFIYNVLSLIMVSKMLMVIFK